MSKVFVQTQFSEVYTEWKFYDSLKVWGLSEDLWDSNKRISSISVPWASGQTTECGKGTGLWKGIQSPLTLCWRTSVLRFCSWLHDLKWCFSTSRSWPLLSPGTGLEFYLLCLRNLGNFCTSLNYVCGWNDMTFIKLQDTISFSYDLWCLLLLTCFSSVIWSTFLRGDFFFFSTSGFS